MAIDPELSKSAGIQSMSWDFPPSIQEQLRQIQQMQINHSLQLQGVIQMQTNQSLQLQAISLGLQAIERKLSPNVDPRLQRAIGRLEASTQNLQEAVDKYNGSI